MADSSRPALASGVTASNDASASSASSAIRTRSSRPSADAAADTTSTPPTVSPLTSSPSASPTPVASASRLARLTSATSAAETRRSAARSHPKATSSGAPRLSSISSAVSMPRRGGLPSFGARAHTARHQRDGDRAEEQTGGEDQARGGQDRGGHADAHRAGERRHERRLKALEVEVLQSIDVGDHPRQQIAGAVGHRAARARAARCARRTWSGPRRARAAPGHGRRGAPGSGRPDGRGRRTGPRRSSPRATGWPGAPPPARSDSRPSPSTRRRTARSARRAVTSSPRATGARAPGRRERRAWRSCGPPVVAACMAAPSTMMTTRSA